MPDDKATELWAALEERDLHGAWHVALAGYPKLLAALEEQPCHWAVPCGEREKMRGEPPDPCVRCKALARECERLLEELNG